MRIDRELAELSPERESVLTIGVFDGVHRGHRYLMGLLVREAAEASLLAGVVTFRNHPASVLREGFRPSYLTPLGERLRLIRETGVDFAVPITFDLDLSKLGAREFALLLQRRLRMAGIVLGPDFAMGRDRQGDPETLRVLGEEMGFSVKVVQLLDAGSEPIRSTAIRKAVVDGDVEGAAEMLGRSFVATGKVVTGAGRGRSLGFPTANLEIPADMAVPGDGIYATWARLGDRRFMAATSIGTRPTFGVSERTVEAFVLDFDGDLYGAELRLEFVKRLRDEVTYDSVQALKHQVDLDVDQTRAVLLGSRPAVR